MHLIEGVAEILRFLEEGRLSFIQDLLAGLI